MSVFRSLRAAFSPSAAIPSDQAIAAPRRLSAPGQALQIALRPINADDEQEWNEVRYDNKDWLSYWDSGDPMPGEPLTFNTWLRSQRQAERQGAGIQFVIEYQMRIVGYISLGAISYGSMRSGTVGYWVARSFAGYGAAPLALSLLADWAFLADSGPRLHRLQIAVLPENKRSRRVVEKLHCHAEGRQVRSMYVRGAWRDHDVYSLIADDAPEGFVTRYVADCRATHASDS